jgi:sugar phosphate isomerase/epimerase
LKLAVSNIAWGQEGLPEFLSLLRGLGCDGVELCPGLLWSDPVESTRVERETMSALVAGAGLELVGLHALMRSRPELEIFGEPSTRRAMAEYLKQLCNLCGELGGRVLVFGNPQSRRRGALPHDRALTIGADFFRDVAEAAHDAGVLLLIEPLSPAETDFVTSTDEGLQLVDLISHPACRLHLDAKALFRESGDRAAAIARAVPICEHFHASEPGLSAIGTSGGDHAALGRALRSAGYDRYVSIEMSPGSASSLAEEIERSVMRIRCCYLDETGG